MQAEPADTAPRVDAIRALARAFAVPDDAVARGQLATTILPLAALLTAMYVLAPVSWLLVLLLAIPAGGFVVRTFIIQHDCGHGSFFRSRRANDIVGRLCSVLTFTPYAHWRRQHAQHHGIWNDLDHRTGGVDILSSCPTVAEYRALPPWRRAVARVVRHPVTTFAVLPALIFLLLYRVPFDTPARSRRERRSVWVTDAALLVVYGGLAALLGIRTVLLVHLPVILVAGTIGVWLFSVQHRFENVRWTRTAEWTPIDAALDGSIHLHLPSPLRWITGNIGYHHIHHLNPRVPNYHLRSCHETLRRMVDVPAVGLRQAIAASRLALWDEQKGRLVSFREAASSA